MNAVCPRCGRSHDVPMDRAGQRFRCVNQACREVITVPNAEPPIEVSRARGMFALKCPSCGTAHQVQATLAGQVVACECGRGLMVPTVAPAGAEPVAALATVASRPLGRRPTPLPFVDVRISAGVVGSVGLLSGLILGAVGLANINRDSGLFMACGGLVSAGSAWLLMGLVSVFLDVARDIHAIRQRLDQR